MTDDISLERNDSRERITFSWEKFLVREFLPFEDLLLSLYRISLLMGSLSCEDPYLSPRASQAACEFTANDWDLRS